LEEGLGPFDVFSEPEQVGHVGLEFFNLLLLDVQHPLALVRHSSGGELVLEVAGCWELQVVCLVSGGVDVDVVVVVRQRFPPLQVVRVAVVHNLLAQPGSQTQQNSY